MNKKNIIVLSSLLFAFILLQLILMNKGKDSYSKNYNLSSNPFKKEAVVQRNKISTQKIRVRLIKELKPKKPHIVKKVKAPSIKKINELKNKGPKRNEKSKIYKVKASNRIKELGKALIGIKGEKIADLPPISVSYDSIGFWKYSHLIYETGGRFFVWDDVKNKIVAEIDPLKKTTKKPSPITGYSPRSREISNEPAIGELLSEAGQVFGISYYSVILLLPLDVDFLLYGGIERYLLNHEMSSENFSYLEGKYNLNKKGKLILSINEGHLKNGLSKNLNIVLNLGEI